MIFDASALLFPDIFVPEIWVSLNEVRHQADAIRIIEHNKFDSVLPEEILSAEEVPILANDDARNAIKQ